MQQKNIAALFAFFGLIPAFYMASNNALGADNSSGAAVTILTQLKLPCSDPSGQMGLEAMGDSFKKCAELFGKCERDPAYFSSPNQVLTTGDGSDGFPTSPGVRAQIKDALVRQVIKNRIQNLYDGVNRVADLNSQVEVRRSQLWRSASNDTINACNVFVSEGSINLGSALGYGMIEASGSVDLPVSVDANNGARGTQRDAPHDTAKRSMFNLGRNYNERTQEYQARGAVAIGGTTAPAYKSCGTWPTHLVNFYAEAKVCRKKYEPTQVRKGEDTQTHIDSVVWDDGSNATPGTEDCNENYVINFNGATVISALQTGALVQATWMKLDEVLQEVQAGQLRLTHSLCQTYASSYYDKMKSAMQALDDAKACGRSFKQVMAGCKIDKDGHFTQSDCYIAGLVTTLQTSGFTQIAECEVYKRAHDLYGSLFLDAPGKAYANQLKNWAAMGCMAWAKLTDGSGHDSKRAAQLTQYLNLCFPKTYTIAFLGYLKKNPPSHGTQVMKVVDLEKRLVNLSGNSTTYLGRASAGYMGEVLNSSGQSYIKVDEGILYDTTPPSPPDQNTTMNLMYPEGIDHWFKQKSSVARHLGDPSWLFGFSFLSLGFVSPRRRRSLAAFSIGTSILCAPAYAGESHMIVTVQYSCTGLNGVLLTGKQGEKCCTYSDGSSGANIKTGDGSQSGDSDVNCPGDPDEILEDLSLRAGSTNGAAEAGISAIQALASNNEGISPNSPLSGVQNPASEGQTNPYSNGNTVLSSGGKDSVAAGADNGTLTRSVAGQTFSGAGAGNSMVGSGGSGSGSGGGGSSGGGTGGGKLGSGGTDPLRAAAQSGNGGQENGGDGSALGGGAFASGGGVGFGSGGGGRSINNDLDSSNIGWGLGQAGAQGSRSSQDSNEVTSLSADPEDYFTRIGIEDNIFKKVEQIYRKKTLPLILNK